MPRVRTTDTAALTNSGSSDAGTVTGVHQHERVETLRRAESHCLRDESTHRVPQEREVGPVQLIGERQGVAGEDGDGVGALSGRLGALAVPAVVRCDGVPSGLGQRVDPFGEVLFGAGESVQEEQRSSPGS